MHFTCQSRFQMAHAAKTNGISSLQRRMSITAFAPNYVSVLIIDTPFKIQLYIDTLTLADKNKKAMMLQAGGIKQ